MRLSRYFLPVLKENPAEAQIVSHRLMLRAGMIKQSAAGIYSWLPLGLKVLKNIENIVHEEQAKAGHLAMLMPTIQSADLWRESGRYDDYGEEMLRIKDRHGRDMLFTPTAEELITDIFRGHVTSYKDMPNTPAPMKPMMRRFSPRCPKSAAKWRAGLKWGRFFTLAQNIPKLWGPRSRTVMVNRCLCIWAAMASA